MLSLLPKRLLARTEWDLCHIQADMHASFCSICRVLLVYSFLFLALCIVAEWACVSLVFTFQVSRGFSSYFWELTAIACAQGFGVSNSVCCIQCMTSALTVLKVNSCGAAVLTCRCPIWWQENMKFNLWTEERFGCVNIFSRYNQRTTATQICKSSTRIKATALVTSNWIFQVNYILNAADDLVNYLWCVVFMLESV